MEKDIRKKLLERSKDACSYMLEKCVTLQELEGIVDKIPSSEFEPLQIFREIEADNDRLYDTDVTEIIEYLSAYKEYQLILDDSGCGWASFTFGKNENETDEEIVCRLLPWVKSDCSDIMKGKEKKLTIKEEKRRLQEKIKELDRQLNSM